MSYNRRSHMGYSERCIERMQWLENARKLLQQSPLPVMPQAPHFLTEERDDCFFEPCMCTIYLYSALSKDHGAHSKFVENTSTVKWVLKASPKRYVYQLVIAALQVGILLQNYGSQSYAAHTHRGYIPASLQARIPSSTNIIKTRPLVTGSVQTIDSATGTNQLAAGTNTPQTTGCRKRAASRSSEELQQQSAAEKHEAAEMQPRLELHIAALHGLKASEVGTMENLNLFLDIVHDVYSIEISRLPPIDAFDADKGLLTPLSVKWRALHAMVIDNCMDGIETEFAPALASGVERFGSLRESKRVQLSLHWRWQMNHKSVNPESQRSGRQISGYMSEDMQLPVATLNSFFSTILGQDVATLQDNMPEEVYGPSEPLDPAQSRQMRVPSYASAPCMLTACPVSDGLRLAELTHRLIPYVDVRLALLQRSKSINDAIANAELFALLRVHAAHIIAGAAQHSYDLTRTIGYINHVRGDDCVDSFVSQQLCAISEAIRKNYMSLGQWTGVYDLQPR